MAGCEKTRPEMLAQYRIEERRIRDEHERGVKKPEQLAAGCQMLLHLLRIDLNLDCPELAESVPEVEIPL